MAFPPSSLNFFLHEAREKNSIAEAKHLTISGLFSKAMNDGSISDVEFD